MSQVSRNGNTRISTTWILLLNTEGAMGREAILRYVANLMPSALRVIGMLKGYHILYLKSIMRTIVRLMGVQ
ncbi:hypothetical protein [Caldivirga sp.]|uniref:hypothetical protein n=1 Tax=Caldivirga sp. TaxID=2080243 RepID=UPI003D0CB3B4